MDIFNENKSLSVIIFEKICEDILNEKYNPGEKITEVKLAEKFGISRTPIREALKQLEQHGLVENIANQGCFVREITVQDIEDIYTIYLTVESIAVKLSIERITKEDLEKLKEIYELMEFYTYKKNIDKIFQLSTKFHETIYKSMKSKFLGQILKNFRLFIKPYRYVSVKNEGRLYDMLKEYGLILQSFIEHDTEKAVAQVIKHNTVLKPIINSKSKYT